jgi:23S rRNA A1618 N6-methylase RlmF
MQPFLGGRINYLEWINEEQKIFNLMKKPIQLIDIGCGNSAIYLLLGNRLFGWTGIGIDSEQQYLDVAQKIIDVNQLPILLVHGNTFNNLKLSSKQFKISVCNPPYYDITEPRTNLTTIT